MLEYKPRLRPNTKINSWSPTHDNKNRGQVTSATYYPPVASGQWTARSYPTSPAPVQSAYAFGFCNDRFLMTDSNYHLYQSLNGINWTLAATLSEQQTYFVGYFYGKYCTGNMTLQSSTDLITWSSATIASLAGFSVGTVAQATSGIQLPDRYVILFTRGNYPAGSRWTTYALSTTNGTTWSTNQIKQDTWSYGYTPLIYGNNTLVASMKDTLNWPTPLPQVAYKSTDNGVTWTKITGLPGTSWSTFSFAMGKWIFVQDYMSLGYETTNPPEVCKIWTSPDLINWTLAKTFSRYDFGQQTFGESQQYAQGLAMIGGQRAYDGSPQQGTVAVSEDLVSWTTQNTSMNYTTHIANGNGIWCAHNWAAQVSTSQQGKVPTSGLILSVDAANTQSYPLPRTGTVWYDLSGNNNNGNFVRNVTWQSTDQGRMNIDGLTKSYISIPNSASLQFGSVFTVQAWIRPTYMGARHSIFSTRLAGSGGGFSFECGTNEAGTNRIGVSGVGTWIYRSPDNQVALNAWTNVCYVRNGSSQSMYVNGVLISPASTVAYNITNNSANKAIGIGNVETTEFYGQIAKVLVYNRALDAKEVNDNYYVSKTIYQT